VQELEEENPRLRESSEGLKGALARTEAGQQSAVARLQDAIAAGGSKVNEDLWNVQTELAKMKEEIKPMTVAKLKEEDVAPMSSPPLAPETGKTVPPIDEGTEDNTCFVMGEGHGYRD
jgi:hypothetical protein